MTIFPGDDRQVEVSVWGLSDVGQVRSENQDAFLVAELRETPDEEGFLLGPDSPELLEGGEARVQVGPRGLLLLVADGMGGAAGGAVASRLAATVITETLEQRWGRERVQTPAEFTRCLQEAVEEANRRVFERAGHQPELSGMGTTATVAGILDGMVYLAQVGDSRGYLIRNQQMVQITRDQSMVQELVEQGAMTQEEAERSVHRSVLLQALGTEPQVNVAMTYHQLCRDDQLLLCSDGLTGPLADDEIARTVIDADTPATACHELVALANERGGPDNISVVLARVHGSGLTPASPDEEVALRTFESDAL